MVQVCQILPSSANVFENCQTLSNAGKMMQDVTYCVHNNFAHDVQHMSAMIYFFKIVQNCSMSNRFSKFTRNIGVWSGAEVCRSCRSTDLEKCQEKKHPLEIFGYDIVED